MVLQHLACTHFVHTQYYEHLEAHFSSWEGFRSVVSTAHVRYHRYPGNTLVCCSLRVKKVTLEGIPRCKLCKHQELDDWWLVYRVRQCSTAESATIVLIPATNFLEYSLPMLASFAKALMPRKATSK